MVGTCLAWHGMAWHGMAWYVCFIRRGQYRDVEEEEEVIKTDCKRRRGRRAKMTDRQKYKMT